MMKEVCAYVGTCSMHVDLSVKRRREAGVVRHEGWVRREGRRRSGGVRSGMWFN